MNISAQILRFTPIFMVIVAIVYMSKLAIDPTLFMIKTYTKERVCEKKAESDTNDSEKNRGMLMSLVSAFMLNGVGALMAKSGVPEGYIVLNYGFILGPVIGYLLDVGFATDEGLRATKRGFADGSMYAISTLASPAFFRYILTVLLDMFISNPIQDAIKLYLSDARNAIPHNAFGYGDMVKTNFPSLLQSIVGIATFQAYTNDTRFRWAYTTNPTGRISDDTIMLATAVAAAIFVSYTISGSESVSRRMPFVIAALMMLSVGNSMKWKSCNGSVNLFQANDDDIGLTDEIRVSIGAVMFAFFCTIGIVLPFAHAKKGLFK